jgi:hypothetical protein
MSMGWIAAALGWILVAWEVIDPRAAPYPQWRTLIRRFSGFDAGDLAPIWPASDAARGVIAVALRADRLRSAFALGIAGLLVTGGLAASGASAPTAGLAGGPLLFAAALAWRERMQWEMALRDDRPDPVHVTRIVLLARLRLTLTRLVGAPLGLGLTIHAALGSSGLATGAGWAVGLLTLAAALYRALYRP